jgi:hypothetical protein
MLSAGFVGLAAAVCSAANYDIKPVGPQDGTLYQNLGAYDLTGAYGLWGWSNGNLYTQAGIHTLPAILASDVASAQLIIPANHGDFFGTGVGPHVLSTGPSGIGINWNVDHFDALDDSTLSGGAVGGDLAQPSLGNLGLYVAGPTWPGQDNSRVVTLDVTTALKADLLAGRGSFAWRLMPDQPSTQGWNDTATLFFPSSDMPAAAGYPNYGARLVITTVPEPTAALMLLCGGTMMALRRRRN